MVPSIEEMWMESEAVVCIYRNFQIRNYLSLNYSSPNFYHTIYLIGTNINSICSLEGFLDGKNLPANQEMQETWV